MEGLCCSLLEHGPVKVFADKVENSEEYDSKSKLNIQRVSGFKIFRKYRKANLVSEFVNKNQIRAIFFDHWKSLENINESAIKNITSICLIHSKEINHAVGTSLNKRMNKAFTKCKIIVANSKFTKKMASNLGVDISKINVINPGCSASRAISMKKNEEPQMLAAVSNRTQSNLSKGFTSLRKSELCFLLSLTSERYRHISFTTKER